MFCFYSRPESTPPKESTNRSLLAAFWSLIPSSSHCHAPGGEGGAQVTRLILFLIVTPPPNSWVSREKKGGGRREARGGVCTRGHQMVFTAYCAAFITLTHKYRNVQSQELGLEVDFWPLGRRPRPDCAVLLARLAKPGLSWTPIAVFF